MTGTRVISAALIAAALVAALWWLPAVGLAGILSLILLAAAWEWSALIGAKPATRLAFLGGVAALCLLWWQLSAMGQGLRALLWAAFAFWSLALLWLVLRVRTNRTTIVVAGLLALSFAWIALVRMRLEWEQGQLAILYLLLIVWLADSGAYFAGRRWGVARLAPTVSPGKTWAGFWGGLAACALLALSMALWRDLPMPALLAVTLVATLYSVVGDLTESLAKRHAGVKDSGSLIPGHGGVLDRFDSLLAAAPILMLGIELLPELRG